MLHKQTRLQLSVLAIAFGIFGTVYVLKDPILSHQLISLAAIILASAAYLYSLHLSPRIPKMSAGFILFTAAVVRIGAIPLPIFVDDLLYRTIWDGWLQTNGVNPYLYVPASGQLELLKNNELYPLIFREGHFASSSPLFEVIYRFIGFLFDHFGLAYTILIHKGTALLVDLAIVYSLIKLGTVTHLRAHHTVAFAWNPFLILFFTSQGLLLQLAALPFIGFYYFYKEKNYYTAALFWGMVMLTSPIGFLGLPFILFGPNMNAHKGLMLAGAVGTYMAWWLPFAGITELKHYLLGLTGYWVNGITHLSFGNALGMLWPSATLNIELIWLITAGSCLAAAIIIVLIRYPPKTVHRTIMYMYGLGLTLFFASPAILLSIIPVLFVLAIITNRLLRLTSVLSLLLLINFLYWQYDAVYATFIFILLLSFTAILYGWKKNSPAGRWLHAY